MGQPEVLLTQPLHFGSIENTCKAIAEKGRGFKERQDLGFAGEVILYNTSICLFTAADCVELSLPTGPI
jgi:hypothetical protein